MNSLDEYNFNLPKELIAGQPLQDRAAARMLMVNRSANSFDDTEFQRLPRILRKGDLVVFNDTKVFPARLYGRSETGAAVEIFLIRENGDDTWEALARPAKRLKAGKRIIFDEDLAAEALDRSEDGSVVIKFDAAGDIHEHLDRVGRTPLPPYIKREADSIDRDRERYQTVFATKRGAIAAPTAGLHFTPAIIAELHSNGIETTRVTLHVGYGTFEPVRTDDLSKHQVQPEQYEITEQTSKTLEAAKAEGRRIIAVGTTTTRTLEHVIEKYEGFTAGTGYADLTIRPGHRFLAIDGLLTNFHLPKSSLLVLISAFAGRELIMEAYRHAVRSEYRFYSYGDCMLIV